MGLIYCDICHGTIPQGFGVVGRSIAINNMCCKNCKARRCSTCSVGRYCKNCLKLLSPEIQQKALKSHRFSKITNLIINVIWVLNIIYWILAKTNFIYLDDDVYENFGRITLIIFLGYAPIMIIFNIVMSIYQNILWESNLKKKDS